MHGSDVTLCQLDAVPRFCPGRVHYGAVAGLRVAPKHQARLFGPHGLHADLVADRDAQRLGALGRHALRNRRRADAPARRRARPVTRPRRDERKGARLARAALPMPGETGRARRARSAAGAAGRCSLALKHR